MVLLACASNSNSSADQPVSSFLTASDWVVGQNRVPFALVRNDGSTIENANLSVKFYSRTPDGERELQSSESAIFYKIKGSTEHFHPDGLAHDHPVFRNLYVVPEVALSTSGIWLGQITGTDKDGNSLDITDLNFVVNTKSQTLIVGDPAPSIINPTLNDVADIAEITSAKQPNYHFYQLTVAEALSQSKPLVLVFASPSFCVTAMCGPVTEVVSEQSDAYSDSVNFIHIEPWDLQIARNFSRLKPSRSTQDWGLKTEPWVFVINAQGKIFSRFEGLLSSSELQHAIARVLK